MKSEKTSTAFLIYRPVMDHEESEESYLICLTKERAEQVISEVIDYAKNTLSGLESLYNEESEMLPDEEYFEIEQRNNDKLGAAIWPYGIALTGDIPWREYNPTFNESCIAIRELPLV